MTETSMHFFWPIYRQRGNEFGYAWRIPATGYQVANLHSKLRVRRGPRCPKNRTKTKLMTEPATYLECKQARLFSAAMWTEVQREGQARKQFVHKILASGRSLQGQRRLLDSSVRSALHAARTLQELAQAVEDGSVGATC